MSAKTGAVIAAIAVVSIVLVVKIAKSQGINLL